MIQEDAGRVIIRFVRHPPSVSNSAASVTGMRSEMKNYRKIRVLLVLSIHLSCNQIKFLIFDYHFVIGMFINQRLSGIRFNLSHISRLNSVSIILFWENTGSASENDEVFEILNRSFYSSM